MASPFQTKEFQLLLQKNRELLESVGFNDIEDEYGRIKDHKSIHDLKARVHFQPGIFELTLEYYSWASERLHSGTFRNARDYAMWSMHAEGLTGTEIAGKMGYKNRKWPNRLLQKIRNYLK